LIGRREDGAVVSYHGPCGPAVAVSLALSKSSEPATELWPGPSDTTNGDATPAAITPVEVRGGSSSADEFEIDIHAAASDVPKQPPVSVNLVKRRILFKSTPYR
jgi:hypothetical protein